MDNSMIGIKVADGTYFPILEEEGAGKKKLVLTTVNDDQGSVQIDLYKGEGKELQDALYIGSLVIEDIMPMMKGEPEIELIIGVDEEGNLNAEAGEAASNERQSLSVSLTSLDEGEFSTPNFELDESGLDDFPSIDEPEEEEAVFDDIGDIGDFGDDFPDDLSQDTSMDLSDEPVMEDDDFGDIESFDEESFDEESFDEGPEEGFEDTYEDSYGESDSEYPDEQPRKRSPLAIIILIVLIIAILGLGALLVLRGMRGDTVPPLEADNTPAVTEPEYAEPAEPEPEIVAEAEPAPPVEVEEPAAPESKAEPAPVEEPAAAPAPTVTYDTVPPEGHGGGVWYRLKWGDTLWDLSNSFYRTPWLYGLIAVENKIKNPDIIYAGTDILIPEN